MQSPCKYHLMSADFFLGFKKTCYCWKLPEIKCTNDPYFFVVAYIHFLLKRPKKHISETVHFRKENYWYITFFLSLKIEEMVEVFLTSANFAKHTFSTLAPPSSYALNSKALIKVSKGSWTSQLFYEILKSSFERKFDKTNFISPKRTPPKIPHHLGLNCICIMSW